MTRSPDQPADDDLICVTCPSRALSRGRFDVASHPDPRQYTLDRASGYQVDQTSGVAVCVHPHKVGLPAGAYASEGTKLPANTPATVEGDVWDDPDLVDRLLDNDGPDVVDMRRALAAETPTAARRRFPRARAVFRRQSAR
ncbi:hypothetical protein [Protofrankia symbiont of Coriaria ruscifolia]|uniref:Uncharacterized protein n=1 Tax=Candidatus Protofrankia californiensis TaxID=1839754 RepID=A0A1C3NVA1_9ACTN|nr:hypothetical protein [Protofrankia symbiont of Coriaria ruscifolia]SBW19360.1 hypothetical protein FDG2_1274 [Candidatus Protofrankia californiensis]